jgi:toxin FitB
VSGFLLDTNVISEVVRPKPEPRVIAWLEAADEDLLFLSALTIGEIRKGITALSEPTRKASLEKWLVSDLMVRFENRILSIDYLVAERWGRIAGTLTEQGILLPVIDGLLASTAMHHNLTLVTRNIRDVTRTGVATFDPWTV